MHLKVIEAKIWCHVTYIEIPGWSLITFLYRKFLYRKVICNHTHPFWGKGLIKLKQELAIWIERQNGFHHNTAADTQFKKHGKLDKYFIDPTLSRTGWELLFSFVEGAMQSHWRSVSHPKHFSNIPHKCCKSLCFKFKVQISINRVSQIQSVSLH